MCWWSLSARSAFRKFLALEDALSTLVDRRVDLVTREALKPHIGRRVLNEAVRL
jgi:uncharacterized protein